MPHINVLDKHTAELIAAGEVVERPASVVKELVENSIDAGASFVVVEIKNGGISFIRVSDNGCGIDKDEVKTAFLRHATSKIASPCDLDKIGTLGFRGEALASISAVSKVSMLTKTKDSISGVSVALDGGEVLEFNDAGCPDGTTIIIRELFFNTPARMKFLKKDVTEGNSVAGVIDRLALSHPEVSFKFIRDGRQELFTTGDNNLKSCAYSVFGREFESTLIEVCDECGGIKVKGLVSKPEMSRKNRTMQFFFLNGRYVKSVTAMVALEEAYKNSIMVGKFPACILNIEMTYDMVDVNVHPAKTEVRFANEKPVFNAVYRCVKNALISKHETPEIQINKQQPKFNIFSENKREYSQTEFKNYDSMLKTVEKISASEKTLVTNPPKQEHFYEIVDPKSATEQVNQNDSGFLYHKANEPDIVVSFAENDIINPEATTENITINQQVNAGDKPHNLNCTYLQEKNDAQPQMSENKAESEIKPAVNEYSDAVVIGEAFKTYIIAQTKDEILFIDKHAAHERILYEKLKSNRGELRRQVLLSPAIVNLSKDDYDAVMQNKDKLLYYGIDFDSFGNSAIIVREFPLELQKSDVADIVCELATNLRKGKKDITPEILDDTYHRMACRAAIKGGDKTTQDEFYAIIKILAENDEIRYCPHGRPVAFSIFKNEIEKRFGRLG